jgi:hypothetical protein
MTAALEKWKASNGQLDLTNEEDYSDISVLQSMLAGVGSGLIAIPKGFASLGASLMDLGADTNKAAEVEKYFDDLTNLDEMAEATTAGKITETLVNIGFPAVGAYSAGANLAAKAFQAGKAGKYFKLTEPNLVKGAKQATKLNARGKTAQFIVGTAASGVAEGVFVGDVNEIGTFGDLLGGPTELERTDDYDPTIEILNRVKFGTEGALFTGILSGVGKSIKNLATRGAKNRFSNSKIDQALDKIASFARARGGKTQEFFDLERRQIGLRAQDIQLAKQTSRELDKRIDAIFPAWKTISDRSPLGKDRKDVLEQINDVMLSGKPTLNKAGNVKFGDVDAAKKTKLIKRLRNIIGDDPDKLKNIDDIFDNISAIRTGWGEMFSALSTRITGKQLNEFKGLFGNKFKDWMGQTYDVYQNKSLIPFFNWKPATEAVEATKKMFIEQAEKNGVKLNEGQAENYVNRIIKSAQKQGLPKGFVMDKPSSPLFEMPIFRKGTIQEDLVNLDNSKLISKEARKNIEAVLGKAKNPMQTILDGTTRLSLITRRNQFFNELLEQSDKIGAASSTGRKMFYTEAEKVSGVAAKELNTARFRKIRIDPEKTLEAGSTNPLNGMYAIDEIADALEETSKQVNSLTSQIYAGFVLYPKATSQMAKTILSPITHIRNFVSASAFATANGVIPDPTAIKFAYQALQAPLPGMRKQNERYRKMLQLGVTNSNVRLGDLRSLIGDTNLVQNAAMIAPRWLSRFASKARGVGEDLYTAEDDFWKMATFSVESRRLGKAYERAGVKRTIDEIEEEAADIVRNNIPNYDYVSEFVKGLRKLPLGNFVSFPAEIMRTGTNIARRGLKEINYTTVNDKGETVKPLARIGYQRLIGMAATTAAIPAGTVAAFKTIHNVTNDEMEALRRYVADWSKNSTLLPIRDEETGKLDKYVDFSHANPYDILIRPFQTITNAVASGREDEDGMMDDFLRGMFTAGKEVASPFISESIWTEAVSDILIRGGRTREGFEVFNEQDSDGNKAYKIMAHLVKSQAPLSYPTLKRLKISLKNKDDPDSFDPQGRQFEFGDELWGFVGARNVKIDPERTFKYKTADFVRGSRDSKRLFTKEALRSGVVTPEQIVDSYINANRALFGVKKEYKLDIDAARILDINEEKLYESLQRGASKKEIGALEEGIFRPYDISREIYNTIGENAERLGVANPMEIAEPVISSIYDMLSIAPLSLATFPEFENPFSTPTEEQPVTSNISGLAQVNPQLLQPPVTSVNTQIPYSQMNLAQKAEYDKLIFNR